MKKELFEQLTQSLREAGEIKRGALKPARVFRLDPRERPRESTGEAGPVAVQVRGHPRDQH